MPKGRKISVWTPELQARLRQLAADHTRAATCVILGMTELQVKGAAQRMGVTFARKAERRRPVFNRPPVTFGRRSDAGRIHIALANFDRSIDIKRADARLRRFDGGEA